MALDKVCFDNQVSTFSDKILWFEVNVEDPDDDYTDDDDYFGTVTVLHENIILFKIFWISTFDLFRPGGLGQDGREQRRHSISF